MFLSVVESKSNNKALSTGSLVTSSSATNLSKLVTMMNNESGGNSPTGKIGISKLNGLGSNMTKRSSSYDEFQCDGDSQGSNLVLTSSTTTSCVSSGSPNVGGGLHYISSLNNNFEWSYKVDTQRERRKRSNSFKDLCFMLPLLSIVNSSAFSIVMENASQMLYASQNSEYGNFYEKSLASVYNQIDRELSKSYNFSVSPATSSPINAILIPASPNSSHDVLSDTSDYSAISLPNSPSSSGSNLHLHMESSAKQHSPSESNSNVLHLREKFIQFIVNSHSNHSCNIFGSRLKEGISCKQLAEVSVRTKLMFLDLFYACSRVHAKKPIHTCKDLIVLLEQLTFNLVRTSGDVILEEMDIDLLNHMVEQQTSLPYYRHMSETKNFECVQHERLKHFLDSTFSRIFQSPDDSELQESIFSELLLEVRCICDMIYLELEDIYSVFQSISPYRESVEDFLGKGIEENTLPLHVIHMYKKKLEAEKDFHSEKSHSLLLRDQDFQAKNIIDKDWNLVKYLSRGHTTDWEVVQTINQNDTKPEKKASKSGSLNGDTTNEKLINPSPYSIITYNSKKPYHNGSDTKELKCSKMITTVDYSIKQVAKTFGHDYVLSEEFSDVEFTDFLPLHESNSMHKYPSCTFNAHVELGSQNKKKKMEGILSTKVSLVNTPGLGNELNEISFVYKSCHATSNKKESITIWCAPVFTRIDNHRTRVLQFKLSNIGSLSSSLFSSSKQFLKKSISEDYSRIVKELQSARKDDFAIPSETNNIMRTIRDYCMHYHNMDIRDMIKSN